MPGGQAPELSQHLLDAKGIGPRELQRPLALAALVRGDQEGKALVLLQLGGRRGARSDREGPDSPESRDPPS